MRLLKVVFFLFLASFTYSQEFEVYDNGLIYSEKTMKKLTYIVDSLNLKFQACELNKSYYATKQGLADWVHIEDVNKSKVIEDLKENISISEFRSKYPSAKVTSSSLITQSEYDDKIQYINVDLEGNYNSRLTPDNKNELNGDLKGQWVYEFYDGSLNAIYFPEGIKTSKISDKYARKIGYADCLIDTSSTKFKEDMEYGDVDLPKNYDKLPQFKKDTLLNRMRSTRVVGFCSMDTRPRTHAVNIAKLSASAVNWEVFLRAHLDIMNDRFERMSDGSYAWDQRQTYIKELEKLEINVHDLIIGISLRMENPSQNHYYSSIGRVGRALSETSEPAKIKDELLVMIQDDELDLYNRLIVYYIFMNFNYYIKDAKEKASNEAQLSQAIQSFPKEWHSILKTKWD